MLGDVRAMLKLARISGAGFDETVHGVSAFETVKCTQCGAASRCEPASFKSRVDLSREDSANAAGLAMALRRLAISRFQVGVFGEERDFVTVR